MNEALRICNTKCQIANSLRCLILHWLFLYLKKYVIQTKIEARVKNIDDVFISIE